MFNTKCICGLVYVGHANWSGTRSILVFNRTNGIATEGSKNSIAVTDLPTTNLIHQNVSILLACRSGSTKFNTDSIAAAMSKHFKGIVLGSENKLNINGSGPYSPSEYGETIWNEFYGVNT